MSEVPQSEDMADQDTHQETTVVKAEDGQSANKDDENHQKETKDSASSSAPTNADSDDEMGGDRESADIEKGVSTHPPHPEGSSLVDQATTQSTGVTRKDNSTPCQDEDGSQGDHTGVSQENQRLTLTEGDHTGKREALKEPHQPTSDVNTTDQVDGANAGFNARSTDTGAGGDDGSSLETQLSPSAPLTALPQETSNEKRQTTPIENIGPKSSEPASAVFTSSAAEINTGDKEASKQSDDITVDDEKDKPTDESSSETEVPPEDEEPQAPCPVIDKPSPGEVPPEDEEPRPPCPVIDKPSPGGKNIYLIVLGVAIAAVAVLAMQFGSQPESLPQRDDVRQIEIFLTQLKEVQTQFPNQRAELWNRSRIHLLRHLQTAQPTEPVSLILTAGVRAERTLHCLAKGLASAFSTALNASVLYIDGASKASQDSDQVKLDIDSKLQGAFEGDKPVAVIHRFEELPPGSTLIFYRYCDHENAAYKNTFLIFTVLLGEEEEISAKSRLNTVEEMVDDHLQKKFLSSDQPVSFDRMDLDKYGGLWSRISHLILPVTAEKTVEHEGC